MTADGFWKEKNQNPTRHPEGSIPCRDCVIVVARS